MIDRKVRRELLRKLKVSRQAIFQRAKRLKEKYGPMTTDEAVYIIAHIEGIDLAKYLPLETLDRIRSLVPRDIKPQSSMPEGAPQKAISTKKRKGAVSYPLVKATFIQQAVALGEEAYPQIVVLENSIRALIEQRLSAISANWWTDLVPASVRTSVQRTIDKEKRYPYREKRGQNPLVYCNFADLKEIVTANHSEFRDVIPDLEWFKTKMDEVYMARNNLAHSVLLTKDDMTRIALFYRDWARLLEAANIK
ncbi:MAG: hypothetical protein KatS3mg053_1793 [Candidatus Roseilinea sp.]|nr:MAG: hypothetical protein KatS3mg053_1793 [Candidatus Roseilinea sp.]